MEQNTVEGFLFTVSPKHLPAFVIGVELQPVSPRAMRILRGKWNFLSWGDSQISEPWDTMNERFGIVR